MAKTVLWASKALATQTAFSAESGLGRPELSGGVPSAKGSSANVDALAVSGRVLDEVGAEQEQWSSHLEEELNKKQMTSDQLTTALNLNKQRIPAIITGHQMATMQEQQRISDRLGIALRLLFTDIPP